MLVVSDPHQGGNLYVLQTRARVMLLPGYDMAEVTGQRGNSRHPDFEDFVDDVSMRRKIIGHKAGFDRVLANISFKSLFNHTLTELQRNAFGLRERRSTRSQDELAHFPWVVQG